MLPSEIAVRFRDVAMAIYRTRDLGKGMRQHDQRLAGRASERCVISRIQKCRLAVWIMPPVRSDFDHLFIVPWAAGR